MRTITSITRHRRNPTGQVAITKQTAAPVGRFRKATTHELAAAQDIVLDQLDTANSYLAELLAEAEAIRDQTR